MHETHLIQGNLGFFEGSNWIENEVNHISNLLYTICVHQSCEFLFILSSN